MHAPQDQRAVQDGHVSCKAARLDDTLRYSGWVSHSSLRACACVQLRYTNTGREDSGKSPARLVSFISMTSRLLVHRSGARRSHARRCAPEWGSYHGNVHCNRVRCRESPAAASASVPFWSVRFGRQQTQASMHASLLRAEGTSPSLLVRSRLLHCHPHPINHAHLCNAQAFARALHKTRWRKRASGINPPQ